MTTHDDVALKLALNSHLILNNEHKRLSYQFLRTYDYTTMDLFEVSKRLNLIF